MDVLSKLVQQKKKDVAELKRDGQKWILRKDIAKKSRQDATKASEEATDKRKGQERKRLKELEHFLSTKTKKSASSKEELEGKDVDRTKETTSSAAEEEQEEDPSLVKYEVIRRLRRKGQVVTYFGETDWGRYKRLCELEMAEHGDELGGGQHNLFLRLLEDQNSSTTSKRGGDHSLRARRRISDAEAFDEDYYDDDDNKDGSLQDVKEGESRERSRGEQVRDWIRKMLNEWGHELQQRTEGERNSAVGKIKTAQCKQTRKDLRPLMKKLKHGDLDEAILEKVHAMVTMCESKEYKKAHDKYIELSIGNAAWPMGVTMVGIHERAGRSKIFTSERKYPTDPSKMISISTIHI